MSVGWSPTGAANEGQPQDAVSRMGVGPPHTIEEVTEGDEVMEKRGRQDGSESCGRRGNAAFEA